MDLGSAALKACALTLVLSLQYPARLSFVCLGGGAHMIALGATPGFILKGSLFFFFFFYTRLGCGCFCALAWKHMAD